jgi:AcrR family transcriptional regulator
MRIDADSPDKRLRDDRRLLFRRAMPTDPASRVARRSSADTKARIIEAAQIAFSTRGYAQSVLTEIAESADVTAPLIIRYFGSKEGLFEVAFSQCLDALPVFAADPADFARVAIGLMTGGHEPTKRASGMISHSIGDPRSRDITMRLIRRRVIGPLAETMSGADGAVRAELMVMLGIGYTTMRMVLPADHPDGDESGILADWLVDAVQSIVDWPYARQPDVAEPASCQPA